MNSTSSIIRAAFQEQKISFHNCSIVDESTCKREGVNNEHGTWNLGNAVDWHHEYIYYVVADDKKVQVWKLTAARVRIQVKHGFILIISILNHLYIFESPERKTRDK